MELFQGKTLLATKTLGEVDVIEALENEIVGMLFSASWCPPCQDFVTFLNQVHKELRNRNCAFQVVYLSCDKSEDEMKQYVSQKHGNWYMLPYADPGIQWV